MRADIMQFLTSPQFAVVGASTNPAKFGNKVLRCYIQNNKPVIPVNPNEAVIEGINCVKEVSELPAAVASISVITPPQITTAVVKAAINHGIKNIWLQPGAESAEAIELCHQHGINLIADGSCILVELGFPH
jgi:predicted CoA-binding protein